jgi:homoserine kinase
VSLKTGSRILAEDILVPGSVANLGGGFDTLGVAVDLYLKVRVVDLREDGVRRLVVTRSRPPVSGENALERAFDLMVECTGARVPSVYVEVESDIPMAAGLGSSAAATVAGLRVFERVAGPQSDDLLLRVASQAEGHADNAAPALLGGLTSVVDRASGPLALRWRWPEGLKLVVATPAVELATAKARAALPDTLPRKDAIFNLQHVLSLVHALQSGDDERLREAVQDRWHQPSRVPLVPLLAEALALEDPAILGSFLSGAGPSIAFLGRDGCPRIEQRVRALYDGAGRRVTVRTLNVHQASSHLNRLERLGREPAAQDDTPRIAGPEILEPNDDLHARPSAAERR